MKILSWNCNGSLRTKIKVILQEYADVYCFQESENPEKWYKSIEKDFLYPFYINENNNKGISILVRKGFDASNLFLNDKFENNNYGEVKDKSFKYFLPIKINEKYKIINCWCHKNGASHFAYKGQLWKFLVSNNKSIDKDTILIGDFNANKIWDDPDCWWNMSDNNKILNNLGLYSAYHITQNEKLGEETLSTFYLYRHLDKAFHIDYAYVNPQKLVSFKILDKDIYLRYSDHVPLLLEII